MGSEGGSAHSSVDLFVVEDPETDFSSVCSETTDDFQFPVEDNVDSGSLNGSSRDPTSPDAADGRKDTVEEKISKLAKQDSSQTEDSYVDAVESQADGKKEPIAEEVVAKEETAVEEKTVTKEEAPVEEKALTKEEAPVEEKPVTKEEAPVEKKAVTKEEAPVEEKAVAKEEAPVEEKVEPKEKAPVEEKAVVKEEAPVEEKAVVKEAPVEE